MTTQTLLDTDFATLKFHPKTGIVHHQFHKFIFGNAFRTVLTTGVEAMEKHKATKWLSDDRKNGALPEEDAEWARTVWNPRAVKAGWKFWAVVLPQKVLGQMNMQRFIAMYKEQGLEARAFTDIETALAWLESVA